MKKNKLLFLCLLMLTFLFVYTASSKLMDMDSFLSVLRNQPLPRFSIPVLVWLVPISELIIALFLLFDATRWWGLLGSFALMLLFTIYIALVLLHVFQKVPCSCGGVIRQLGWRQHLFFNIFFLIVAYAGIKIFMHEHREYRNPV